MKAGALQPPWMREQKASQQPQHQTEKTREDGDASPQGEPGDISPARKREKKETKTRAYADEEAGMNELQTQMQDRGKGGAPKETQGRAEKTYRELNIQERRRKQR